MRLHAEAYFRAAELWLHKFNRIPDHRRGFGDLKEFAENWSEYEKAFGMASLYESVFHVDDIDKPLDDPTRREYSVRRIANAVHDGDGEMHEYITEPQRYADFKERGKYINPDSLTPVEARRDYPHNIAIQLEPGSTTAMGIETIPSSNEPQSLYRRLGEFMRSDFEAKFVALVRKTSMERAKRKEANR